jgi:hypothetical protein
VLQKAGHFFTKHPLGANSDARFTANTVIPVFKHNVFMPQKINLADYLFWAGTDTFPAGGTFSVICPNIRGPDPVYSISAFSHCFTPCLYRQR